jgi:G:T/U-mismatch repair DNA glycosylase
MTESPYFLNQSTAPSGSPERGPLAKPGPKQPSKGKKRKRSDNAALPLKTGLPPILGSTPPTILILGSGPSEASLRTQQYYAHPQNHFWPVVGELFGVSTSAAYEQRCSQLCGCCACVVWLAQQYCWWCVLRTSRGVAVWDTLSEFRRDGSLDANMTAEGVNDFPKFLREHPTIKVIGCNGEHAG